MDQRQSLARGGRRRRNNVPKMANSRTPREALNGQAHQFGMATEELSRAVA